MNVNKYVFVCIFENFLGCIDWKIGNGIGDGYKRMMALNTP